MTLLYNILQLILLPVLIVPATLIVLCIPKYRMRSLQRLGIGLAAIPDTNKNKNEKRIWIHALSVGEVSSALPLVAGIRKELPDIRIVFSASSRAGAATAKKLLADEIDYFIPFPFDILPVIKHFLKRIQPDCFILVETDFWPNFLSALQTKNIPSLLVNGRISVKSMRSYRRFSFFFRPVFNTFHTLSMQTEHDRQSLINLGIDDRKVQTLGNLKYDNALFSSSKRNLPLPFTLPDNILLITAGSTHKGEEEIVLQSYRELQKTFPNLYIVIAPRNIERGRAIQALAQTLGLQGNLRSQINAGGRDLFILDVIGELNTVYSHCQIAFVGGSLVPRGGHNPIEPAVFAVPVICGEHMEDFSEITDKLLQTGGAFSVRNATDLSDTLLRLLGDEPARNAAGDAAMTCIREQQGVIHRHIKLLKQLL